MSTCCVTVTRDSRRDYRVTQRVSHGTPTQPVPTRPSPAPSFTHSTLMASLLSYRASRATMPCIGGGR